MKTQSDFHVPERFRKLDAEILDQKRMMASEMYSALLKIQVATSLEEARDIARMALALVRQEVQFE